MENTVEIALQMWNGINVIEDLFGHQWHEVVHSATTRMVVLFDGADQSAANQRPTDCETSEAAGWIPLPCSTNEEAVNDVHSKLQPRDVRAEIRNRGLPRAASSQPLIGSPPAGDQSGTVIFLEPKAEIRGQGST